MSLILYLILLAVSGLFVGALGRLALPGRDPMTIGQTMLIGIVGSLIAGLIALGLFHDRGGAGLLLSVLCTMGLVYAVRRMRGGQMGRDGAVPRASGRGLRR